MYLTNVAILTIDDSSGNIIKRLYDKSIHILTGKTDPEINGKYVKSVNYFNL